MNNFFTWLTKIMAVLNALKSSPELWAAIQGLIGMFDNTPDGALAQMDTAQSDKLQKLIDDSPEVKAAIRDVTANNPDGTQAFGIGEVGALLAILKQLYDFWKSRK